MTGPAADLAALARDTAIQALSATEAPIALTDELVAMVTGGALKAVIACRVGLATTKGHTIDNDDMLPIGWFPMEARQSLERIKAEMLEKPRDLPLIRALLVEATAFAMAGIDRLDRAMLGGEG